jgi:hypothetical protein
VASEHPGSGNAHWSRLIRALYEFGIFPLDAERNRGTYDWNILCHAMPKDEIHMVSTRDRVILKIRKEDGPMSVQEGLRRKQEGRLRVEGRSLGFLRIMRSYARSVSSRRGRVTCDDLREFAKKNNIQPHHPNVWGSIFRGNNWVFIGWTTSRVSSNHARENRVWRSRGSRRACGGEGL